MLNLTIFVEAFLLLVATGWSYLSGISLRTILIFNYKAALIGVGVGVLMAGFAYGLYRMSRPSGILSQLRETVDRFLIPLVSELRPIDIVIIAVISGFCEEIFFRGVAQQKFGLLISSLAFGVFHDPSFRNLSYSILAFFYGLVLGFLFIYTGNIWAPIFAHAVHNLISLLVLRYWVKPPAAPVSQ